MRAVLLALKSHKCFSMLHIDPRTILKTPVHSLPISKVAGGEYLHLGLRTGLYNILKSTPLHMIPDFLELDCSTDEASLDKASKILMWPIQIRVANITACYPEIVGIFQGLKKPTSATEFSDPFVDELLSVLANGFQFEGKNIPVHLRCFIADAPARAFVLGHRGHNSKSPCSKCHVVGRSVRPGVMVYEGVNHAPRTEEEYALKTDALHHKDVSALAKLPLNPVSNTVFDYMHLVCLGLMKKILQGLIDGRFVQSAKLSPKNIVILTKRLEQVKKFCPRDFARKPVTVLKHSKFKATELRQILLYSGPIVFCGLLNDAVFKHFLLLHSAIRLLANPFQTQDNVTYAEECIKVFVETASDVYGVKFLSYNTHALLHLPDDVRSFGFLDSFSAFPYENNMTYCRKLCRKPNQHLQQIAKRRAENCRTACTKYVDPSALKFVKKYPSGPKPPIEDCLSYEQYKKVVTGTIHLSVLRQDNTVILRDGSIGIVKNVIDHKDKGCFLLLRLFTKVEDVFNYPCSSSLLEGFLCSALSSNLALINLNQIVGKCFRMPYWSPNVSTAQCSTEYFAVFTILSTQFLD